MLSEYFIKNAPVDFCDFLEENKGCKIISCSVAIDMKNMEVSSMLLGSEKEQDSLLSCVALVNMIETVTRDFDEDMRKTIIQSATEALKEKGFGSAKTEKNQG